MLIRPRSPRAIVAACADGTSRGRRGHDSGDATSGCRERWRLRRLLSAEDGSTLLMYPFAVLIVLAIGAIAIDGAVLFQAHRQAVDVAAGLASDMAAVIDEEAFATTGDVLIDRDRAGVVLAYANDVVLADHPNELVCGAVIGVDSVSVTCSGVGEAVLLTAGGGAPRLSFRATSTASARERG